MVVYEVCVMIRKFIEILIAPLLLWASLLVATPARAATLVDQMSPSVLPTGFCDADSSFICGQSFQQGHTNIAGAGVYLNLVSNPGTLNISIYSNYSSTPSGLIATGSSYVSSPGWVDVFWTPDRCRANDDLLYGLERRCLRNAGSA